MTLLVPLPHHLHIKQLARRFPICCFFPRFRTDIQSSQHRWREGWTVQPSPAAPTTAKLVPIVTTASSVDALELAHTYIRRWPVQENIIRDFLLPLGLDTNHGYTKTSIVNSEAAKKRAALEKKLHNAQQWVAGAKARSHKAGLLYHRLWQQTKEYGDQRYRQLNAHQDALREQGVGYDERRAKIKEEKALIDAELAEGESGGRAYPVTISLTGIAPAWNSSHVADSLFLRIVHLQY
jgi:hypothetical protein